MDMIIKQLMNELNLQENQIQEVLKMLSEGATIPFIARYRKERTKGLNEDQIRAIETSYKYQKNLLERKEDVIRLIDEKKMLTEELKNNILSCQKLSEVEDLYRPYKEKKKTKASEAIKLGLEPLAKKIMSFPINCSLHDLCKNYEIEENKALENAGYIISEWISDNAFYRKLIRNYIYNTGLITTKIKKDANDEKKTYQMYYDYQEKIKTIKHFRVLAINRAEKEKIITVSIQFDKEFIKNKLTEKIIKNPQSSVVNFVIDCIDDSLKRLILPSIEREIRSDLTEKASKLAINTFIVLFKSI